MGKYLKEYLMKTNLMEQNKLYGEMEEYIKENLVKEKFLEKDK